MRPSGKWHFARTELIEDPELAEKGLRKFVAKLDSACLGMVNYPREYTDDSPLDSRGNRAIYHKYRDASPASFRADYCHCPRQSVHNQLEFTEDDLPREMTQPEVVAAKVCEMFDGEKPVKIADVARALEMNYGTCKTHLHRAAQMNLLTLVLRKGFLPGNGPRKKLKWR